MMTKRNEVTSKAIASLAGKLQHDLQDAHPLDEIAIVKFVRPGGYTIITPISNVKNLSRLAGSLMTQAENHLKLKKKKARP